MKAELDDKTSGERSLGEEKASLLDQMYVYRILLSIILIILIILIIFDIIVDH